ncbi:MAG: cysteine--tRNA ligase [Chlamydiota bacterium]
MSEFLLYNTATRSKTPVAGDTISLYTCGPTVYNYAHIGNLRTYVFEDLLKRSLLLFSSRVQHVMNITDVDDKTIRGAIAEGSSLEEFCAPFLQGFHEDLDALAILPADGYPKATEHIPRMIAMIEQLCEKGHAYQGGDGSVYFSISSYKKYGQLAHLSLSELKQGASRRLHLDEYDKESVSDFVLWKAYHPKRDGAIFWESPFGRGRPGWHIECSAMCLQHLGDTIDIHCGGVDNIFPHHENEIAQSECCTGKLFVRVWCHAAHLIVDGAKMSKSKNNFYTLRDLVAKGYDPLEVRYLLLHTHYRSPLNFTFDGLDAARSSLERIRDAIYRLEQVEKAGGENLFADAYCERFKSALADDLNISLALGSLFDLLRAAHLLMDQNMLTSQGAQHTLQVLRYMDRVLGCCFTKEATVPQNVADALTCREKARKEKNWEEADRWRDEITSLGYQIEDSPSGPRLKKGSTLSK